MKNSTLLAALLALAACQNKGEAPAPPASVQDIMVDMVEPAADALWQSVSSEVTREGIEEKQPHTDAEWLAVRAHALQLVQAGKLLAHSPRPVTHGGRQVEDADVPGVLPVAAIERAIAARPREFQVRAAELQESAGRALAAIDARHPGRLLAAGAAIDRSCERCHQAYWYPQAPGPQVKWPAPLAGAGQR